MKNKFNKDRYGYFIATVFLLVAIFVLILFLEDQRRAQIQKLTPSKILTYNIYKNKKNILNSLNNEMNKTKQSIDHEIDKLFNPVFKRIDVFLDYHYSVLGEYEELGTIVFGDINQMVANKLFKKDFSKKFMIHANLIAKKHRIDLTNHINNLHKYLLEGIDLNINDNLIKKLNSDIYTDILKEEKRLNKLSSKVSLIIAKTISAEISTNSVTKSATKSGVKFATNTATAGTGAAAGLFCGPFAWICSPVAAGILLFSVDAAVTTGDELLNRENFKKEIVELLNLNKQILKDGYIKECERSIDKISNQTIKKYKLLPIKNKKYSILEF